MCVCLYYHVSLGMCNVNELVKCDFMNLYDLLTSLTFAIF